MVGSALYAQTSLGGKVVDDTGEAVLFGNVALYKNGVLLSGGTTDIDGNYNLGNLDPGTYDVELSYTGFQTQRIAGVIIYAGKANKLDATLTAGVVLNEVVVMEIIPPVTSPNLAASPPVITCNCSISDSGIKAPLTRTPSI